VVAGGAVRRLANGTAMHRDGSLWITDYRRGLLRLDLSSPAPGRATVGDPMEILGHRNSESFKGLNDLTFDTDGNCYFTDQGQTGLPRSERARVSTAHQRAAGPPLRRHSSPNGIALDTSGKFLFIAVTRANQVWRGPLLPDGSITKVGAFRTSSARAAPTAWQWTWKTARRGARRASVVHSSATRAARSRIS